MILRLPERAYYSLDDLTAEWSISSSHVHYCMTEGLLNAHVQAPTMSVFKIGEIIKGGAVHENRELTHFKGFAGLSRYECWRLFRSGRIKLRQFSSECGKYHYALPEASNDFIINPADLVILRKEKLRFEAKYARQLEPHASGSTDADPDFRSLKIDGKIIRFGDVQTKILKLLYEAANQGDPWQNGKQILQRAGSVSFTLSNVFKHKPVWTRIIESDRRGAYRLKPDFIQHND